MSCQYIRDMKRNEVLQIRLTAEEKEMLQRLAGKQSLSDYVREELNLETVTKHPVPTEDEFIEAAQSHYEAHKAIVPEPKRFTRLVKQLEAQGISDPERVARKRLGM